MTTHAIRYGTTSTPNHIGLTRKALHCTCGKRYSGWDLGDVIRRMERHVTEANAENAGVKL